MNSSLPECHDRAIVIGGSIAGLLAARVLADRFRRVTIVERDRGEPDGDRKGVPHARHLHVLLRRGLLAFEELFPGLRAELEAAGAEPVRQGTDFRVRFRSGWAPEVADGLELLSLTRGLLERTVRERVVGLARVEWLPGSRVDGLLADPAGRRVLGVRAGGAQLPADLVVDASGRGSQAPGWLAAIGREPPEENVVDAFWGYAMRIYRRPPTGPPWKQMLILNRPPDQPRVGVVQPIENGRWLINVAGVMKDYPPNDEDGFLDFVRRLPSPELYQAIRDAEPLSPIHGFRHTANRLRRYDRRALPERMLVIGDAVCAFNPVYGQGMTVAALEALALRDRLGAPLGRVGRRFQRDAARIVAGPWMFATSEDSRWPGTAGAAQGRRVRFLHWYVDQVIGLIPTAPAIYRRFQAVQHMTRSPAALFHPRVLAGVLARALGRGPARSC
jgi:2-polyprenyl-6-methoxyphenol hydroxylase-like FAD-dependent oxidoreductase